MNSRVLPILPDGDGPIARQGRRIVSRAEFLAEIWDLAEQLPERPYVVNFCADRVPVHRGVGGCHAARPDYPVAEQPGWRRRGGTAFGLRGAVYVLTDDDAESGLDPCFTYPAMRPTGTESRVPAFPPDRIAAVLFTSGSTRRPNPSPRRWGRLVAGSLAAGLALGVGQHRGLAVVATVPHAHSYGLESAVMLPLRHGLLLTAERPFFPADIAAALEQDRLPGILVTAPVHLRALVGDAAGPGFGTSFRAGFVLSATAALSPELAARAEAAFDAPVLEIYGCSEAGQLATRRTTEGSVWRCLEGFSLHNDTAGCWASGPDEPDVLLADEIESVEKDRFILKGRTADLVNVAGKRSSLAYLTRQLTAIDGVQDGVFVMPEDDAAGATPRLAAIAVAPGLDAATILGRLRGRIEAAFLPRPLHVVEALPRNELGKLPRSELLRLIGSLQADSVESAPVLLLRFPADHPASAGHFPGNPVVPGAVMLDALVRLLFPGGWSGTVESAKFHFPVRPGDTMEVTHKTQDHATRFECRLMGTRQRVLSGVLRSPFPLR